MDPSRTDRKKRIKSFEDLYFFDVVIELRKNVTQVCDF